MSRNILLTGGPAQVRREVSGLLGQRLGRQVVDVQDEIARWTGEGIDQLRDQQGPEAVNDLEAEVLGRLTEFDDLVLASGPSPSRQLAGRALPVLTTSVFDLDAILPAPGLTSSHGDGPSRPSAVDCESIVGQIITMALQQQDTLTPSEHEQVMT